MGETCGTPWEVLVEAVMPTCRLYVGNLPKDRAVNLSCLSIFGLAQSLIQLVLAQACAQREFQRPPLQHECWRHVQHWVR